MRIPAVGDEAARAFLSKILPEATAHEGVDDRVDAGVGVGQNVREDLESVHGLGPREILLVESEVEVDYVDRQPAQREDDDHAHDHDRHLALLMLGTALMLIVCRRFIPCSNRENNMSVN